MNVLLGIGSKWSIVRQIIIEVHDIENRLKEIISILRENDFIINVEKQETEVRTSLCGKLLCNFIDVSLLYLRKLFILITQI